MTYVWTSDLETKDHNIDGQHQQLFMVVNELISSCQVGIQGDEVKKTIDFLINYTATHFDDEEKFQIRHNYPEYARHKQFHEDFKAVIFNLAEQLIREDTGITLTLALGNTVGGWLTNHIKKEDLRMVRHVREQSSM